MTYSVRLQRALIVGLIFSVMLNVVLYGAWMSALPTDVTSQTP